MYFPNHHEKKTIHIPKKRQENLKLVIRRTTNGLKIFIKNYKIRQKNSQ